MAKKDNKVKNRELRFLWHSNALYTQSGYAVFTRDILKRAVADGWDVAQVANHGVESYPTEIEGVKVFPRMGDIHGADAILHHSLKNNYPVVFTMLDIWILQSQFLEEMQQQGIKWIPYLPIDQEPVPPGILSNLRYAHKIITFSQFGKNALAKEGYASRLIYEGIDTNIFKPMDRSEVRKEYGIPQDAFVFGMIGANKENPPRKGYQEALEAFKLFSNNHPEARLFIHSQQINPGGGFPIHDYARHLKILDKLLYLDQYKASYASGSNEIAKEINCFDVQLHPSQTEGFGMLVVESQSCGVPPIINRCTSMPELIVENKTGWACETGKPWWRNLNGYVYPADVNSLHEKMELAYTELKDPKKRAKIAKEARQNVLNNYNIDRLFKNSWIPFLEELQEELLNKK